MHGKVEMFSIILEWTQPLSPIQKQNVVTRLFNGRMCGKHSPKDITRCPEGWERVNTIMILVIKYKIPKENMH